MLMETVQLSIQSMKSPHCQMTVSGVVKELGAEIISIVPTKIELSLKDGLSKHAVITAIEKAGYAVSN